MEGILEISIKKLEALRLKPELLILDIREKEEFEGFNIGGTNIPAHEITQKLEHIKKYKTIVVICSNGMRSSIIARVLAKKLPKTKILHLSEGIN